MRPPHTREGLNKLQRTLSIDQLSRSIAEINHLFATAGIDLFSHLAALGAQREHDKDETPITIVDLGCGSGGSLENIIRFATREGMPGRFTGIGVDMNPCPQALGPNDLIFQNRDWGSSLHFTQLKEGNVCSIPLEDNSADLCFSAGTFIYVDDTLRALSEVHRILKPSAIGIIDLHPKDATFEPKFIDILDHTPGARETFSTHLDPRPPHDGGAILCSKLPEPIFTEFPFTMTAVLVPPAYYQPIPSAPWKSHYRNAVYKAIGQL